MTTLKGVFPDPKPVKQKDFIHENVRNLRRMEQCLHTNKEAEKVQRLRIHEQKSIGNKYQNIRSKMNSNLQVKKHKCIDINLIVNNKTDQQPKTYIKSNSSMLNKTTVTTVTRNTLHPTRNNHSSIKQKRKECKNMHKSAKKTNEKVSSDPNLSCDLTKHTDNNRNVQSKFRNQGIQTLDAKEMDNLYSDGMIRYPSKKCLNNNDAKNKNEPNQQNDKALRDTTNTPLDQGDVKVYDKGLQNKNNSKGSELLPSKAEVDVAKLNKKCTSVASKIATRLNNSNNVPPANYRKGVVPKYIKTRKEAQEKELKAKAEELDPDCPSGHVHLPEHERKETLQILKKSYQDYVNELNMMPIKTDTLRAQQRKTEIEKQLNKLEEGIKVFSKPKVYVKMNA
ncbi:uncharacterized protein LOC128891947 isoform X1 [Hylaeus anthracinus]|uniref:uncharacterized protein LOC128891947 isoform X1 n=1 Tax=Hylaeus anthracinus TaxID=313031 RepID=UPI0023B949A1|nr:uncharacterized protein LOC128891947 isoform X1 [Hylaeus anthracinus]